MTTSRQNIGLAEARGCLAEAKAIGNVVRLIRPGVADVNPLYVLLDEMIGAETVGKFTSGGGRRVQRGTLEIKIPVQTGFAVMTDDVRPIREGHEFEYPIGSGRLFFVDADPDSIKQTSQGYIFHVKAIERKTATLGARA